jgi:isopentenyl-diphosphate Delta-isomerase
MADNEQLVFVNKDGSPTGEVGPKLASHNADTKLHLAFSCYILRRSDNAFLVTQRTHTKKVWPDVWTNSVCGHPSPSEKVEDAIRRRANYELGLKKPEDIRCVVPKYTYKAPPYNGIIEHEFCPIFIAYVNDDPKPNPDEVEAYEWMPWPDYGRVLKIESDKMSYWCKDQYAVLKDLEPFASLK